MKAAWTDIPQERFKVFAFQYRGVSQQLLSAQVTTEYADFFVFHMSNGIVISQLYVMCGTFRLAGRKQKTANTSKHSSHPELLRQLALEVINDIPDQALIIYTDGSRLDTGRADSGIFSNTPGNDVKISIRNSDHCSVFRSESELIAISGALDHAFNSYKDSISILADSRSSIQNLKNWPKIMDSTGLNILSKLARLDQRTQVCLQWIPSHVGVPGNEAADELAGKGCDLSNHSSFVLSHSKIHSLYRTQMNLTWRNPPAHHWYAAKRVLAYLYSAEVLGHIRRPWRALEAVTCVA
ncbi:RNase H domain-containing protein [Trichonephila clavipes]|nr:RNase H domain-containing protein [Trichonephila clavipes]